jgi:hypothetical protein
MLLCLSICITDIYMHKSFYTQRIHQPSWVPDLQRSQFSAVVVLCIPCLNSFIVAYRSNRDTVPLILHLSTRWRSVVNMRPGRFTPMKETHTYWIWVSVDSIHGLDVLKKIKFLSFKGILIPDLPDRSLEITTVTGAIIDMCPPKLIRPTVFIV